MEVKYEGKSKKLHKTDDENILHLVYKDSVTAFNGEKKDNVAGKGRLNNEISCLLFGKLHDAGIKRHFIKRLSETEQLVKKVNVIPLEVIVRNMVAGSLSKRLGLDEGIILPEPLVEFFYKDDNLGDPMVSEEHILILDIASTDSVSQMRGIALKVNDALAGIFSQAGIILVDFKLEFGFDDTGNVLLADEISPDTCRLWDAETNEKLDKDIYRRNLGNMLTGYEEVLNRLRAKL